MPEGVIREEIEKGKKEVAAGREGRLTVSGAYLLAERIADLKNDLQRELTVVKQEIGGLRQEIGRMDIKIDSKIDGLRGEMKEGIRHLDGKLNNTILAAVSVFFAVLLGSAAIIWAIYQSSHQ